MSKDAIIRAWKERTFRAETSSGAAGNPAGVHEIGAEDLKSATGGAPPTYPAPICKNSWYPYTRCSACA